ncbi:hypothetical protein Tco_0705002 [Tanacetum coccineum]|uniref:Uncharacterized protein n=1 Tax=Tanacetum coccineum TaxID=301880 RepID=A0ABQ4Y3I6_9ASTR
MELLMIEGKILKDQENPLGKITEDRRAGIGSPYTEDLTTDCAPTCLKAHERSLPQKRHLKASNSLLIEEAMKSGQLSHLVKGIKKERDKSYTKNKFRNLTLTPKSKKIHSPSERVVILQAPIEIKAKVLCEESKPSAQWIAEAMRSNMNLAIMKLKPSIQSIQGVYNAKNGNMVSKTIHGAIKFHTTRGIGIVFSTHKSDKIKKGMKKIKETPLVSEKGVFSCTTTEEKVVANNKYPEQKPKPVAKNPKAAYRTLQRKAMRPPEGQCRCLFSWTRCAWLKIGIPKTITQLREIPQ